MVPATWGVISLFFLSFFLDKQREAVGYRTTHSSTLVAVIVVVLLLLSRRIDPFAAVDVSSI